MCIDFTSSNKAYPKDGFSLPRIDKIVGSTVGCQVMSLLTIFWLPPNISQRIGQGEHQFHHPFDTYCFVRMPEGLKNVGFTFSRLTQSIFKDQVSQNIFIYVDDIIVTSKSKADHLQIWWRPSLT